MVAKKLVKHGNGGCIRSTIAPPHPDHIRQEDCGTVLLPILVGDLVDGEWVVREIRYQRVGGTYASSRIAGKGRHGTTFFVRTPSKKLLKGVAACVLGRLLRDIAIGNVRQRKANPKYVHLFRRKLLGIFTL